MANWDKLGAITGIFALILSSISLYQANEANQIANKQFESNISIKIHDAALGYKGSWNSLYQQEEIEFIPTQDKEYGATFMKDFNILIDNLGSKADSITSLALYRNYDNTLIYFFNDSFEIYQNNQTIKLPLLIEPDKGKVYLLRVKFFIPKVSWKASGLKFKKYSYNEAKKQFEDVGYPNFGQFVAVMGTEKDLTITAKANQYFHKFCLEFTNKLGKRLMLPIHFNVTGEYDMLSLDKKSPICTNLTNYKE